MSDETAIPPALSADEWVLVRNEGTLSLGSMMNGRADNDVGSSADAWLERLPSGAVQASNDDDAWYAPVIQSERIPAAIAYLNAALPDDDPRKITREWIMNLEIAQHEARLAIPAICMNGPCDECKAACERFCARLQRMAAALASYLPPR